MRLRILVGGAVLALAACAAPQRRAEPQPAAATLPAFRPAGLEPFSLKYQHSLERDGELVESTIVRTLKQEQREGRAVWVVTETAPEEGAENVVAVDAETLLPLRFTGRTPRSSADLGFSPSQVKGVLVAGERRFPIELATRSHPLFAGAALEVAMATANPQPGYRTTVQVLDLLGVKVHEATLEVAGVEQVKLAGGERAGLRIELRSADQDAAVYTWWVEPTGARRTLKARTELPEKLGGAVMTSSLLP